MQARPVLAVLAAALVLGGCTRHVVDVNPDAIRHVADDAVPLTCAHRLAEVSDGRADGDKAGSLGTRSFRFPDATGFVRESLSRSGFRDDVAAPAVHVQIAQLYLGTNDTAVIPVAVYRVRIGDEAPRILRAQLPGMSWSGSEQSAHDAYAHAIDNANAQLVQLLNGRCGSVGSARS